MDKCELLLSQRKSAEPAFHAGWESCRHYHYNRLHPLLVSVCQEHGEHQVWRFSLEIWLLGSYCWYKRSIRFLHLRTKRIWLCSIWFCSWCWRHFIKPRQKMVGASNHSMIRTGRWEDINSSESQGREECAPFFTAGRGGDQEVGLLIRHRRF